MKKRKRKKEKFKPLVTERERRGRALSVFLRAEYVFLLTCTPTAPLIPPYSHFAPEQVIYKRWLSWRIKK